MAAFGEPVVHLTQLFSPDEEDEVWLQHAGKEGMALITRDERIRYRPNELAALRDNNVGAFFLGGKNRSRCELIQQLVRNWPQIKETARKERRPFAFRVRPTGRKMDPIPLTK